MSGYMALPGSGCRHGMVPNSCRDCADLEIASLRARLAEAEGERDALKTGNRHLSEKHLLSQKPHEFLRSRNLNRKCDSDGFIGCERCQTMSVCLALEAAESRAERLEGAHPNLVWLEREEVGRYEVAKDIADAALAWVEDTGVCHFCDYGYPARGDAHDPTCPMVPYKDGALPSFSAARAALERGGKA